MNGRLKFIWSQKNIDIVMIAPLLKKNTGVLKSVTLTKEVSQFLG